MEQLLLAKRDGAVPAWMRIAYAFGLYGITVTYVSVGTLLVYCYTQIYHIPPATAAKVFGFGALVDFLISLVIPWCTVRSHSRLGRYRPFLIFSSVPLGVAFALLFFRPELPPARVILYTFIVQAAFRIVYSVAVMSHASMIARLSSDADERATIGSIKGIASGLGVLTSAYLGLTVIRWFGGADQVLGFRMLGVMFGAVAAFAVLVSSLLVRERVGDLAADGDTKSLTTALWLMLHNAQVVIALGATMVFFIGLTTLTGGVIYEFRYVFHDSEGVRMGIVSIALGEAISPAAWAFVVRNSSKAITWAAGCLMMAAALRALYAVAYLPFPKDPLYFLCGFGQGAVMMNFFAIVADAVDYGHWHSGARTEAYGFGMLALFTKGGDTLGATVLSLLLAWTHLPTTGAPDLATVERLRLVVNLAPAAVILLSGVVMVCFRVTAVRHRRLLRDIEVGLFRSAGSSAWHE